MAQGIPPLHYLSQLYPLPRFGLGGRESEPAVGIPQQAAAGFYNLPPLESLLQPDVLAVEMAPADHRMLRNFDNLFPGYRESANVKDRRGRFDDMMYANELDDAWRSSAVAPLMKRFR